MAAPAVRSVPVVNGDLTVLTVEIGAIAPRLDAALSAEIALSALGIAPVSSVGLMPPVRLRVMDPDRSVLASIALDQMVRVAVAVAPNVVPVVPRGRGVLAAVRVLAPPFKIDVLIDAPCVASAIRRHPAVL